MTRYGFDPRDRNNLWTPAEKHTLRQVWGKVDRATLEAAFPGRDYDNLRDAAHRFGYSPMRQRTYNTPAPAPARALVPGTPDERPTLLFLPEAALTAATWRSMYRHLGAGFVQVDRDKPARDGSQLLACESADDLPADMVELGVPKAILVGHGYGALLALSYAAQYPQRVAGLVLIGLGDRAHVPPCLYEALHPRAALSDSRRAWDQWLWAPETSLVIRCRAPRLADECERLALYRALCRLHSTEAVEWARRLSRDVSVLLLSGQFDRLATPAAVERLAARLPKAEVALIDGAAHLPQLEQARRTNAALDKWLKPLVVNARLWAQPNRQVG